MLLIIFASFTVLYVLTILLFAGGAFFARYRPDRSVRPTVSVVVSARNEGQRLRGCLSSLVSLTYPQELLQIVVINDRSTDDTGAIVREFAEKHINVLLVEGRPPHDHLQGKANALALGIEQATGEILLFTDADCIVPAGWVEETVKYYAREEIGIVAGFTRVRASTWFQAMQTLDWFALFSVAAATARMGFPATAVGNNLSVRRKAYDAVGGYRGVPFSVTEDYALVHAIATRTRYRVVFPMDPGQLVETEPCLTVRDLFHQKKRWFTGGRDMEPGNLLIIASAYAFKALLVCSPFLFGWGVFAASMGAKLLVDLCLLLPALVRFHDLSKLRAFPAMAVYFIVYILLYPPLVLFGSEVTWKERSFPR
jgi:cellulose synthase/poly-beta-1,6-N-acetylglucosamine synthase-like glycosyltransferase